MRDKSAKEFEFLIAPQAEVDAQPWVRSSSIMAQGFSAYRTSTRCHSPSTFAQCCDARLT